jgi:hypothetical protein
MDLGKLTTGDRVVGISAILLLVFSFFPWFEVTAEGDLGLGGSDFSQSVTGNGWDVGFLWAGVPVILGLLLLAYVLVTRFSPQTQLPEVPWGPILLATAGLATLLVILKLLIGIDEGTLIPGYDATAADFFDEADISIDVSRQFGLFLSALAAIGLVVGAFLKFREAEGEAAGGASPPTSF